MVAHGPQGTETGILEEGGRCKSKKVGGKFFFWRVGNGFCPVLIL